MTGPEPVDIHKLAAEIEAEVRARRAAGEYPPGFEREMDALFARFAPPEVSTDFDGALERSEDLVLLDPVIPTASNHPALGIVKRVIAKLISFYHAWFSQQVTALAVALNNALRLLGKRVTELEHITGEVARARSAGRRLPAPRDDSGWQPAVLDALRGCPGRVAVVECGHGELLLEIVKAGLDGYGVEPHRDAADAALGRGLEVRIDDAAAHLQGVGTGALDAVVLRAVVERVTLGELLQLVELAAMRLADGGRLVVCSVALDAWGRGDTAAEADLLPGRPLRPDTWKVLLAERGFAHVQVVGAGNDAYTVVAARADV
jgi:SAM-dependent methyltransferase